jgi:hypothetical protein
MTLCPREAIHERPTGNDDEEAHGSPGGCGVRGDVFIVARHGVAADVWLHHYRPSSMYAAHMPDEYAGVMD